MKTVKDYLEKMKKIQKLFLDFIDNEDRTEENFQNLLQLFIEYNPKMQENKLDIKEIIELIVNISNNHNRSSHLIEKITLILNNIKGEIQKYFSNDEIYKMFKDNKRLLLYLFDEKIIEVNKYIYSQMTNDQNLNSYCYPMYFSAELKTFIKNVDEEELELFDKEYENFEENRHKGENESYICQLIQDDRIEDFIIFLKRTI